LSSCTSGGFLRRAHLHGVSNNNSNAYEGGTQWLVRDRTSAPGGGTKTAQVTYARQIFPQYSQKALI
jgi:hypothetical protein